MSNAFAGAVRPLGGSVHFPIWPVQKEKEKEKEVGGGGGGRSAASRVVGKLGSRRLVVVVVQKVS